MSVSVDVRHHQNAAARVAHKHVVAIVAFILSRGGRCVRTESSAVCAVEVKKDFLHAAVELVSTAADVANDNARETASRFANDLVAGLSDLLVGLSDSHLFLGLWLGVAPCLCPKYSTATATAPQVFLKLVKRVDLDGSVH